MRQGRRARWWPARWLIGCGLAALALLADPAPLVAEAPAAAQAQTAELPADVTTSHQLHRASGTLDYEATAGTLVLRNEKQEPRATVFYVAYRVAAPDRPVTFVFNGGPGAASAYLQIGAIGPRVIDFPDDGSVQPRSSGLVDNPATWLDATDLVFVDPVGTGYSHGAPGVDEAKEFWAVRQDLRTLGEVIQLYLTRVGRTDAPVYLVGESYGGFRAARLAHLLMTQFGVSVAGVTMISPVLDFSLVGRAELNPLPLALRLPSYAASALERQGKLSAAMLQPAEGFALGSYLRFLVEGAPRPEDADRVYAMLAQLTSLPEELVRRVEGRIPLELFQKEFRRDESRIVSAYDGGVSAPDPAPASLDLSGGDPVLDATRPVFTGAMTSYLHDELGFRTERPYRLLNGDVSHRWDWQIGSPWGGLGAIADLKAALSLNPRLRARIVHGMTDLETPYMTSRYVVMHLPPNLASRVALPLYPGGHMMYLRPATRHQLREDALPLYRPAG